jgi:hypothetical protein
LDYFGVRMSPDFGSTSGLPFSHEHCRNIRRLAAPLRRLFQPATNRAAAYALSQQQVFRIREINMECVMRGKIGTAMAAFLLLSGSSLICFAQADGSPSPGEKGVAGSPKAEGIGSTSSTHNPSGSLSSTTGMENRTATGSDMGTNTSTHNPSGKKD